MIRDQRPRSAKSNQKTILTEAGSILLFALAVFAFFALITYHPADPSALSNAVGPAKNACGRVGASVSAALFQGFGMGAFLLPAALLFVAATVLRREGLIRTIGILGGMSFAVMALTVFLTLQWKYWPFAGTLMLTGGAFGAWFADTLLQQFNSLGASIVSLLIFCVALALSTPLSVAQFGAAVIRFVSRWSWRISKLAVTYGAYLAGVLAMRAAHALGDGVQGMMERAARRSRERALMRAQRREEERAAQLIAEAQPPLPELPGSAPTDSLALEEAAEQGLPLETVPVDASEVPNALPELAAASIAQVKMTPQNKPPEILPAEDNELSVKAPGKLARLARHFKSGHWKLPSIEFLRKPPKLESQVDRDKLYQNSHILRQKFLDFGIEGEVTAVRPGPVITLYEFKPGPGVKVSRIAALADDLSMALSAQSVRILAPMPGKSVVGIEIPSDTREIVYLREFLQHPDFHGTKHMIPVVMGKDIGGAPYLSDLGRMPHLLCAGQTGAGKSVFMNGLICSLFYRFTPDELRMILVDPKFIEFRAYQDIPHLLLPVVDDGRQASTALKWAVREMERRYRILAMMGARNLAGFNQKVDEMGADVVRDLLFSEENQPEGTSSQGGGQMSGADWIEAFEPDETGAPHVSKLPYIVIIIDELADLMMVAKKEVEISIARIAQKARAAGIHLVIATQRPSTDVITGLIKANLPSRVSFQLASYIDSKTILDRAGAERLLGQGDMLFIPPGMSQVMRLHGAFLEDDEIHKITAFLKSQGKPVYRDEILVDDEEDEDGFGDDDQDALFTEAVQLVKNSGHASASFLQRHLKVGYNRAARMIETMEARGIVGPADGARPREVLMR